MLLQFNFENFNSFKEKAVLDFSAIKLPEHEEHILELGKEKILPVAAIYGANASGKTNLYLAFKYMQEYVLKSFSYGGDSKDKLNNSFIKPTPYLLKESSRKGGSSFEVYFAIKEENNVINYNYGFKIDKNGVKEEWFNYKNESAKVYREIFYRNRDKKQLELKGIPKSARENIKISLEKEALIISLGAKLKIEKLKFVRDSFMKNKFADFKEPVGTFLKVENVEENFAEDEKVQKRLVKYISSFDPSIVGFNVKILEDGNKGKYLKIGALHKMNDSNQTIAIPLSLESAGTLKMFAIYPLLKKVLETGGVLFIDELNGSLHPLIVRFLVKMFLDKEQNKNNAQLIFITHDVWQLSSNLLRRDEIWFTEKDLKGASTLFSLAEFKEETIGKNRKDGSYEKNYLLGKYGAIPNFKSYFNKETIEKIKS